jgi:hypothetical protein
MNEDYLLNNNKLVEFVIENDVDLIISLNRGCDFSFKKYSTNITFKSYKENIIDEENPIAGLMKKEISFKYDIYNVNSICLI